MAKQITTELVKELRDATGISVMQCKRALEEAEGDMDKALAILKKTSSDIAQKKSDRTVKDGAVMIKSGEGKSVLVALLCETDFVSKNDDFIALLGKLVDIAFSDGVEKMKNSAKEMIDPIIQKTGENIQLGDAYTVEGKVIGNYTHGNKKGVIVALEGGTEEIAKDVAMHYTAMKPEYVSKEDITDEAKRTMYEIFQKEVENVDKPEEIKKKMLDGKISTYFKEKTLLDQPFIKDPSLTVGALLSKAGAKIREIKSYLI